MSQDNEALALDSEYEYERIKTQIWESRKERTSLRENIEKFKAHRRKYRQHLKSMKSAKTCLLLEWRSVETFLGHIETQIKHYDEKLKAVEEKIREHEENLESVRSQIAKVPILGHIIRFPHDD